MRGDETGGVVATIRRIRPGRGAVLASVRLAALADAPTAFASSLAPESGTTPAGWDAQAVRGSAGDASATFLAVADEGVVGMVAGYRPTVAGSSVELCRCGLRPTTDATRRVPIGRRRRGLGRDTGASTVDLWVTRGNDAGVRLYEAQGFTLTGDRQRCRPTRAGTNMRMRLPSADDGRRPGGGVDRQTVTRRVTVATLPTARPSADRTAFFTGST